MNIIIKDNHYKIECSGKEIEYILSNKLKANAKLPLSDIERIAEKAAKRIIKAGLAQVPQDGLTSADFYRNVEAGWYYSCLREIEIGEIYKK